MYFCIQPIVARYSDLDIRRFFRGDAAFARPQLYEYLEAEGYLYAIRLPANGVLHQCSDDAVRGGNLGRKRGTAEAVCPQSGKRALPRPWTPAFTPSEAFRKGLGHLESVCRSARAW